MLMRTGLIILMIVSSSAFALAPYDIGGDTAATSGNTGARTVLQSVGTVTLQVGTGLLLGSAGMTLAKIHPVVGGLGWIAGSSYGVYSMGDMGTGRGDFLWTMGAGTCAVLLLTPAMVRGGSFTAIGVAAAALGSIVAEIVVYHATESPNRTHVDVGCAIDFGRGPQPMMRITILL